jgi:hypothetical protein
MRLWSALGKTDPAHTKQFTRAGGFKGTAIKPMWANQRMTEFFGPCGIGWGMGEPQFNVVPALDELLVFCTVSLWYLDSGQRQAVYGVGGDKVVVKQSSGLRTDDEAFKKAYTDALGNAMKFVGVAADVHMGLFDDNKYVQQVREEFQEAARAEVEAEIERQKADPGGSPSPDVTWSYNSKSGLLFCCPRGVAERKKKQGGGGTYLAVALNGKVGAVDMLYYFHESYSKELLDAVGKVCKFRVDDEDEKYPKLTEILEIDGQKVAKPEGDPEVKARLLASNLGLSEGDLKVELTFACGDWAEVVNRLEARANQSEVTE